MAGSAIASPASSADLRIVIVGHVDHGKSTLVGRLLYETQALPDGKYEQIKASCERRAMAFEWAFLMDALQAERDQNVTIDTTQIWFSSVRRRYCLIDAPGHREFLKNMITGAASADAALLLIDAQEGMKEQTRRHAYLLHLLGIRQVIVVINKMDCVNHDRAIFDVIADECREYLATFGVIPAAVIPLVARDGDGMLHFSDALGWNDGPCLLDALDRLVSPAAPTDAPLRFCVQDIYRFDHRRILAGRIESGRLSVGDRVVFSPSNMQAHIHSIEQWPESPIVKTTASAGESIGITLDEPVFVERGHIASHADELPHLANRLDLRVFWMHSQPLKLGDMLRIKVLNAEYTAQLQQIHQAIDVQTLLSAPADELLPMQVGDITLKLRGIGAFDDYQSLPKTGRCVLFDGYHVAGGGIISTANMPDLRPSAVRDVKSTHLSSVDFEITALQRARQNGHRGGILWFTGLSGSGKSTLAKELQKHLFARGYQVYVLDGDNIRQGLCSDLGFTPEDRTENIRRIGEVANLFADAGFIVITAFISPYADDRHRARSIAAHHFHTVYIKASLDTCESRDVKGLYRKAKSGEIKNFTGVSAPYEEPESPDLTIDTNGVAVDVSVEHLLNYVEQQFIL